MTRTKLHFEREHAAAHFRSGVSLHSHTLHSRETLDFIYRLALGVAPIRFALRRGEAKYRSLHGCDLDLSRAWWTPPLAPHDAWRIETNHIFSRLGMDALVSITDHDNIEAPLMLRVLDECQGVPVSVEWTVPFGGTFVHLGIHNLAIERARYIMSELAAYTAAPHEARLRELLQSLSANLETLIVFNHPCWDEKGIGREKHRAVACELLRRYGPCFHALELNGMRPWRENRCVIELAREFGKPAISGGDRHGVEPNTILNLTNAGTFSEFVEEIREGFSDVLITSQYEEPFFLRIEQNLEDILADHENHGKGWRRWDDRVFYQCDDGVTRSVSQLCGGRSPRVARAFVGAVQWMKQAGVRRRFRAAFARREQVAL